MGLVLILILSCRHLFGLAPALLGTRHTVASPLGRLGSLGSPPAGRSRSLVKCLLQGGQKKSEAV